MADFTRLNAALAALGTAVNNVATAIRNPAVDNNTQPNIDAIAGKLEDIASGLSSLADEENAEDNADAIVEEGNIEQPPAVEETPTGEGGGEPTPGDGGDGGGEPPVT